MQTLQEYRREKARAELIRRAAEDRRRLVREAVDSLTRRAGDREPMAGGSSHGPTRCR